jgi:hypothetical protein
MSILMFSTAVSETFLILRGTERYIIINVHRSSCKVPVILARFLWNLDFLDRFFEKKNIKISNFVNIRPLGGGLFHEYGQTLHDEATSRFT